MLDWFLFYLSLIDWVYVRISTIILILISYIIWERHDIFPDGPIAFGSKLLMDYRRRVEMKESSKAWSKGRKKVLGTVSVIWAMSVVSWMRDCVSGIGELY